MNRRGIAGRAFTLLAAVGVIALLILGFILATSAFLTKQAFDIKEELNGLDTSGQLRLLLATLADDLEKGDCSRVALFAHDAYGPTTTAVIYRDNRLLCGASIEKPDAALTTVLPRPDGSIAEFRVEVKRS